MLGGSAPLESGLARLLMTDEVERELQEAGLSAEEASELAEIAAELRELTPAEPRALWLAGSRARLLARIKKRESGNT